MKKPDSAVTQVPAWLLARYIILGEELARTHGAAFAAAFLNDIGAVPESQDQCHMLVSKLV
jgi:hypothetical protein